MTSLLICMLLLLAPPANQEARLRRAFEIKTGSVTLPSGEFEISREIVIPADAHDLSITGTGTAIKASAAFRGRALIVISGGAKIHLSGIALDGNRDAVSRPLGLPPAETVFARFTPNNGILAENVSGLEIENMRASHIAGFAVLVSGGHDIRIHDSDVSDSGSLDARGRNNTTGGILLEEGVSGFEVSRCRFGGISGNAVWTHSLYHSPRNSHGRIVDNRFAMLARDAIQVGHATDIIVENNTGEFIGYPAAQVDLEHQAFPAALDTAGNVDHSTYRNNRFNEVDGKCIDLDGFHDGEVTGNACVNQAPVEKYPYGNLGIVMNNSNPDMQSRNVRITGNTIDGALFSGMFIIGSGNVIADNHLARLNLAHCNNPGPFNCLYSPKEPDLLRSGIYLGSGAERPDPARNNVIENNTINGYGIEKHCIVAAPGVSLNKNSIRNNQCSGEPELARAR